MAWAALGKGLMGTARAVGGGARMAKSIFKRKGGKNAPEKPASEQTVDVEAQEVKVRPSTSLIPTAPAAAPAPEGRAGAARGRAARGRGPCSSRWHRHSVSLGVEEPHVT